MRKLLLAVSALTVIVSGEVSAGKTATSSTIAYNGIMYNYSSTSTCADGTAALRLNRKWWCPVTSSSASSGSSTSTATTTSGTSTTTSTAGTSTSTASTTWSKVADEWQNFSLSSTQTVRYGAGTNWIERSLSGTQSCTTATFGSDPAYGIVKVCEVALTSTSTTTTASTSTATSSTELTSPSGTTTSSTTSIAPVSYRANLSWTIPSTRADGSPLALSELAGYEVYYTNDSGSVSVSVPVSGGSTASAVVSNLASGNYYFSISAIDSTGLKSALSTVASVSFP